MINFYSKLAIKFRFLFKFSNWKISKMNAHYSVSTTEKRTFFLWPFLLMVPALILIIMFTVVPLAFTINSAFFPRKNLASASSVEFSLTLGFERVVNQELFKVGVRNSILYGLFSLPVTLIIALTISSSIALLYRKWAKGFWQTVFFLPYVTSGVAISLAFVNLFSTKFGIINQILGTNISWLSSGDSNGWQAFGAIFILGVWQNLAFYILILTTAMLSVDKNLYKSASIDGSGQFKQFFKITLPSIKSTTSFLITIGVIGGIKVFPLALFGNNSDLAFIHGGGTLILFVFREVVNSRFEAAGAASIIFFLIGLAYTIVLRSGIEIVIRSSVKWGEWRVQNKVTNSKLNYKTQFKQKQF